MRKYLRRRGKRPEVTKREGWSGTKTGFITRVYDQEVLIERPEKPRPCAYGYWHYDRSGGHTTNAQVLGLLANSLYNREIRPQRVDEYGEAMARGDWRDLLSDPIAITADGQVLNGQHRIAAAVNVDWSKVGNDPAFLVIWNADPKEALHADGSRRTPNDQKVIATKVAGQHAA